MRIFSYFFFAILLTFLFISCAGVRSGKYEKIGHPYSLKEIQELYGVGLKQIKIENSDKSLQEGEWIFIPLNRGISSIFLNPQGKNLPGDTKLIWPLDQEVVRISSDFGRRGFSHHDGLDLPAPKGTKIFASASGKVVLAERVSGYGKMIIIDHGSFQTVYAHTSKNLVRKNQFISQGQLIGLVGRTGHASGYHLHFEVRVEGSPENPLAYLPKDREVTYQ